MKKEIILTADWQNNMSDIIGKITFNDNPKADLYYNLLMKYPQAIKFGVGYIENQLTSETELIEVSMYIEQGKHKK